MKRSNGRANRRRGSQRRNLQPDGNPCVRVERKVRATMEVGKRIMPVRVPRIGNPNCEKCGRFMHRMVSFENGPNWPDDLDDYRTVENWHCECGHKRPFPEQVLEP